MTREEIIDFYCLEDDTIFLDPKDEFDQAIVGVSHDSHHLIYDYEKLLTAIMNQSQSEEEAQEWLDYNIMGGINTNLPGFPIIMYSVG